MLAAFHSKKGGKRTTFWVVHVVDDRQTYDLRHCAKETLQRSKQSKRAQAGGQRGAEDHEHGDDLGPEPDGESFSTVGVSSSS